LSNPVVASFLVAAVAACAEHKRHPGQQRAAAPRPDYVLTWQDEFNGSTLDASKWKPQTRKRDDAQQSADAVSVRNGNLRIKTYTAGGIHYTGFLTTTGLFAMTYGYIEARMAFHGAPGQWCAFWLQSPTLGRVIGDPQTSGTEIDVIEHRVADQDGKDIGGLAAFHLHWDGYGAAHKHVGGKWQAGQSLDGQWHTYAVLWTPESYVFYIDNVPRWRGSEAVSHAAEELRLTCEVRDKSWAGAIPAGGYGTLQDSPYGVEVDWVRVWQKQ
jgi:beta-glucanase (GH16 family)